MSPMLPMLALVPSQNGSPSSSSVLSLFYGKAVRKVLTKVLPNRLLSKMVPADMAELIVRTSMGNKSIPVAIKAAPEEPTYKQLKATLEATIRCEMYKIVSSGRMQLGRGDLEIWKLENWLYYCQFKRISPEGKQLELPAICKFYVTPGFQAQLKGLNTCEWQCKNFTPLRPSSSQHVEHPDNRDILLALFDNERREPPMATFGAKGFGASSAEQFHSFLVKTAAATHLDFVNAEIVESRIVQPKKRKWIGRGDCHVKYRLHVVTTIDHLKPKNEIWRRFKDFRALYKAFTKEGLKTNVPFPSKKVMKFNKFEKNFIECRQQQLNAWLQEVCKLLNIHHFILFETFLTAALFDSKAAAAGKYDNQINVDERRSRFRETARKEHKKMHGQLDKTFDFYPEDVNNGLLKLKLLLMSQFAEADAAKVKGDKDEYEATYKKFCSSRFLRWRMHSGRQPIVREFGNLKAVNGLKCRVQRVLVCAMTPTLSLTNIVVLHVRFYGTQEKVAELVKEFFLDPEGGAYDSWQAFLDGNILPYSYIAYPYFDNQNNYCIDSAVSPENDVIGGEGARKYTLQFRQINGPSLLITRADFAMGSFSTVAFVLAAGFGLTCLFVTIPPAILVSPIFVWVMGGIQFPTVGYYTTRAGYRLRQLIKRRAAKTSLEFISIVVQLGGNGKILRAVCAGQLRFLPIAYRIGYNGTLVARTVVGSASSVMSILPYIVDQRLPRTMPEIGRLCLTGLQTALAWVQTFRQLDTQLIAQQQNEVLKVLNRVDDHGSRLKEAMDVVQHKLVENHGQIIGKDVTISTWNNLGDKEYAQLFGQFIDPILSGRDTKMPDYDDGSVRVNKTWDLNWGTTDFFKAMAIGRTGNAGHSAGTADAFNVFDYFIDKKRFFGFLWEYEKERRVDCDIYSYNLNLWEGTFGNHHIHHTSTFVERHNFWEMLETFTVATICTLSGYLPGAYSAIASEFATDLFGPRVGAIAGIGTALFGNLAGVVNIPRAIVQTGQLVTVTFGPEIGPDGSKFLNCAFGIAGGAFNLTHGGTLLSAFDMAGTPILDAMDVHFVPAIAHFAVALANGQTNLPESVQESWAGFDSFLQEMGAPAGLVSMIGKCTVGDPRGLQQTASIDDLRPGQTISVTIPNKVALQHPGFYIGKNADGVGMVVENNSLPGESVGTLLGRNGGSKGGVHMITLDQFLAHAGPQAPHFWIENLDAQFGPSPFSDSQIVDRALASLNDPRAYNLDCWNCQHFVNYIRYGLTVSPQWEQVYDVMNSYIYQLSTRDLPEFRK